MSSYVAAYGTTFRLLELRVLPKQSNWSEKLTRDIDLVDLMQLSVGVADISEHTNYEYTLYLALQTFGHVVYK